MTNIFANKLFLFMGNYKYTLLSNTNVSKSMSHELQHYLYYFSFIKNTNQSDTRFPWHYPVANKVKDSF